MNDDAPLNEDQQYQKIIGDSISGTVFLDFLKAKGLDNLKCEICGCGDWMTTSAGVFKVDTIAQTVVALDPNGFIMTERRPFLFIFCSDCGNTKQMYADLLKARVFPEYPESKALLELISQSLDQTKENNND